MNRSIYYACAALSLVVLTGCKSPPPNAAVVNGQAITLDEFQKYLMVKPQVQVIVDPSRLQAGNGGQLPQQPYQGQVVASLGLQALSDMVKELIVKQMAIDEGVMPTDQQINDEIADRTKANPTFVSALTNAGLSFQMIRNDLTVDLAQFNLTTKGVTISDADVDKYITDHPTEFTIPESLDMDWLLVSTDQAKAAVDAALKVNDFPSVATKFSIASKVRGIQFPEHYMPRLAAIPNLGAALKKVGQHEPTEWVKFQEGWAKFWVDKRTAEHKVTIDDVMKKKVRRALMLRKGTEGKDLGVRIRDKLRTANVVIVIDALKDPWKKSMDELNQSATAPAPTATQGTPAPAPAGAK